jgi:transcriptional antiterminator RfaH
MRSGMPLVPLEADRFPERLFEEPQVATANGRVWWVVHTRPRQEKSLVRQLHSASIPFYLPLISRRLRIRGRVMNSYLPLFSGYVFLLATGEERITALATSRIVRTLPVADQTELWDDLRQVSRLIATGAPITPEDRLAPGDLVEIRSGPLAGLRGKILRAATGHRFVVQVNFIQRGASVMLEDFMLAKAE